MIVCVVQLTLLGDCGRVHSSLKWKFLIVQTKRNVKLM